ncbi:MAG: hypothetical protein ACM3PB_00285 [Betaproteobacteria bacterium]
MSTENESLSFNVTVAGENDACLARLFVKGEWQGDAEEAGALLNAVCDRWPAGRRVVFIALFSRFQQFHWPEGIRRWDVGDNLNPSPDLMGRLFDEGERCLRSVFTPEMCGRLRRFTRYVTLGADSHYFRDSYYDPHAELVFAIDLESGRLWRTGKSYPNPRQEHGLIRVADLESHFVEMGGIQVMLLSCHDLNLFSPRSYHNARGWRRETIERFRQMAGERRPELMLWHPHKSDTPRTWISGLSGLRKERPGIDYAGAGIYHNDGQTPRASLDSVLKHTKNLPTIDLIIERKSNNY